MKARRARVLTLLATITMLQSSVAHAEAWGEKDKLQDFVTRVDVLTNARSIDAKGLSKSAIKERPWSSTFWPDLLGSVAWRYTMYATNTISNGVAMVVGGWNSSRGKIMRDGYVMNPDGTHKNIMEMSEDGLDRLSPA